MQKVVMVKPNWAEGYVDKYLVANMDLSEIREMRYDAELLSHVQHIQEADYLFRVRHYLQDDKIKEDIFFSTPPRLLAVCNVEMTEYVNKHLNLLRDKQYKLYSIIEGQDMIEDHKFDCPIRTVTRFLNPLQAVDKEMFELIIAELKFSYRKDCLTVWSSASKLPKWLNVRDRLVTDNEKKTVHHTSEHWMLIHKDGTVTFPDIAPTKGAHIDLETKRTIKVYNEAPQALPEDVIKAVKITLGVNAYGGTMHGVALKLYQN